MSAPPLLDTNILVYAATDNPKNGAAVQLMERRFVISAQVLNEFASVMIRKFGWSATRCRASIVDFCALAGPVVVLDTGINALALDLVARHRLAFYDALMLAAALSAGSTIVYTEDMQHGFVVDGRVTVVNPFRQHSA